MKDLAAVRARLAREAGDDSRYGHQGWTFVEQADLRALLAAYDKQVEEIARLRSELERCECSR